MECSKSIKPIILVFGTALLLRTIYLILIGQAHTSDQILLLFPDSEFYVNVAEYLLGWKAVGEEALLFVGPAYGAFLSLWFALFGYSAWPILVFQILLSSLNCVLIFLIAKALLPNRPLVSLLSGMIGAISLTSISLSCSILTETLFFSLQASSLFFLILGIREDRWKWFVASGLLAGTGTLIRSVAQFWPLVMIMIVLLIPKSIDQSRKRLTIKALSAGGIAFIIMFSWAWRNYSLDHVFTLAEVGTRTARDYWASATLTEVEPNLTNRSIQTVRQGLRDKELQQYGQNETFSEKHNEDVRIVMETLQNNPVAMVRIFLSSVVLNVLMESDHLHDYQLPQFGVIWTKLDPFLTGIGPLLFILFCTGLVQLLRSSSSGLAVIVILATYFYFALMSGFTFFQGTRIFFPAQMSWTILVALSLVPIVKAFAPLSRSSISSKK